MFLDSPMTPSLMLAVMARGDNGPTPGGNGTSLAATTQGGRTQYSGLPSLCPAPAHSVYTAKIFPYKAITYHGSTRDGWGGEVQDRPVMLTGDTCLCICIAVSCHSWENHDRYSQGTLGGQTKFWGQLVMLTDGLWKCQIWKGKMENATLGRRDKVAGSGWDPAGRCAALGWPLLPVSQLVASPTNPTHRSIFKFFVIGWDFFL